MSRTNKPTETEPAEYAEGTEIEAGANYAVYDPFRIEDPDPEMKYFYAANDNDAIRPDGVRRLIAEKGYRKSAKQHGATDCVLLEIPRKVWEQREAAKRQRDARAVADSMRPGPGQEVLPGYKHGSR